MKNVSRSTNLMVKVALLATMGFLLTLVDFPILPAFPFLKIDLGDVPALVGAFAFGPVAGIVIEGLKNVLIFLFHNSASGGIGEFANFIVGSAFVGTAALIYSKNKSRKMALIALITSVIIMGVVGVLANYFMLVPLYFKGISTKDLIHYMVAGIIPFNLIKGIVISVATMLIYKRVSVLIRAESLNNDLLTSKGK